MSDELKHATACPECGEPITITYDIDGGQVASSSAPAIPTHPYAIFVEQECEHQIDADTILQREL